MNRKQILAVYNDWREERGFVPFRLMSEKEFLAAANERCRMRIFGRYDYRDFCKSVTLACRHALNGMPFYESADEGGVANSYGSVTSTAQWGVWTDCAGDVHVVVRRVPISGRSVKAAYYGGSRAYKADFARKPKASATRHCGICGLDLSDDDGRLCDQCRVSTRGERPADAIARENVTS